MSFSATAGSPTGTFGPETAAPTGTRDVAFSAQAGTPAVTIAPDKVGTSVTSRYVDIERAVRAFVAEGSGIAAKLVIRGNDEDDGKAPDELFATVLLIDDREVGLPILSYAHAEGIQVRSVRRAVYSVQWFLKGAQEAADNFIMWASSGLGRSPRFSIQRLHVRQRDTIITSAWEDRAQMDLAINYWLTANYATIQDIRAASIVIRTENETIREEINGSAD